MLEEVPDVDRLAQTVARAFYDHVLRYPELGALIQRISTVDQLRHLLSEYVTSLFSGRFDDRRLADVVRIGKVHDRIGLPLTSYLGATAVIDGVVVSGLVERYARDSQRLSRVLTAWRRLFTADIAIVTQTFIDAREHTTTTLVTASGLPR